MSDKGKARMAMRSKGRAAAMLAAAVLATAALATGTTSAQAETVQGKVVRVIDGDSVLLKAADDKPPIEIRLHGIDAPEGCQAGGPEAREALLEMLRGKLVGASMRGRDHYGRSLATLEVEGVIVNQRMVAEGHAWSLRTKWDRGPYVAQERVAQSLKRGLHAAGGAIAPAEFRQRNGPCGKPDGDGAAAAADAARDAGAAPAAAAAPAVRAGLAAPAASASAATAFRCDGRTRCSQMRSCEEATWFLRHCPGVQMDGNGDGVPCERQWCGR